ncbi:hypothetical protein AGABI1DRAFT_86513, partial [Agaricus bisporus var. burnettii JB137-S8]
TYPRLWDPREVEMAERLHRTLVHIYIPLHQISKAPSMTKRVMVRMKEQKKEK